MQFFLFLFSDTISILETLKIRKFMKTSIATGAVLVAIIAGIYFLYTSDMVSNYLKKSTEEITQTQPVPGPAGQPKEFGEFTEFFRKDLTSDEKEELKRVLAERENRLKDVYSVIKKEYDKEEGDMEKAFRRADSIRQEIKNTLLPFLDKTKRAEFEERYRQLGRDLEAEYIAK